jgi:DNA mismatch repair ATPase MutL
MGSATATGFRLESPAIKVFERKTKDSSQPEETTSKDNPSQPRATEPQPLPSVPNPTQRPSALHKPDSQQPSSSANPTARIKQSGLFKTTPPASQQQQRVTSEQTFVPQSASPTPKAETTNKRPEKKPGQKQPATSTPLSEPQSEKPAFKVKVNDQIFTGRDSVTLTQRVVRIDGKPVGQAKMVIVLGQPRTMQADGGVSQGRNQAVLTSR